MGAPFDAPPSCAVFSATGWPQASPCCRRLHIGAGAALAGWRAGLPLGEPASAATVLSPQADYTEQRQDFAINLAREGFEKKACTALLSKGLCDTSPATVAALQALHPTSAPPAVLPLDDLPVAPLLDLENVAQALQSFPADTAPGPSGLRVQHLRDALQNGGGAGLLDQLTLACASVAPLLAGAGLVAASAR